MIDNNWTDGHYQQIERLGIQYGLSLNEAFQVTMDTYLYMREVKSNSETYLYTYALNKMSEIQVREPFMKDLFLFEEDSELHSKIIDLDKELRIPLILSSFQEIENDQIATILEESIANIEVAIQTAKDLLGDYQLDKRLELLKKSYNRIPTQFQAEKLVKTVSPIKVKKDKKNNWLILLGLFLISTLSVTFFLPGKGETEKVATSRFEEEFKVERSLQQEWLMLSNTRFNKLTFIQEADKQMAVFLENEQGYSDEEALVEFDKIRLQLKSPGKMIAGSQYEHNLRADEEKSIEYLTLYRSKIKDLLEIYDEILWDFRIEIENFEVKHYLNKADRLMEKPEEFPEELKNMLFTMKEESIQLVENKSTGEIQTKFLMTDMYREAQWNFHQNTFGYLYLIANEAQVIGEMLSDPHQEFFYNLFIMEETLQNVIKDDVLYPVLYEEYVSTLHQLIKGSSSEQIFSEQGSVKFDTREIWQRISNMYDIRPSKYILMPIVEEMEKSGWGSSTAWDTFTKESIKDVLELARTGDLERSMYGERPTFEDDSISLPDEKFFKQVEQLYKEFKVSYDRSVFKGLSPLLMVGVYDYSNEMKDPRTMYHLLRKDFDQYSETGIQQSLEEFIASWKQGISIFKDTNQINFIADNVYRMHHDFTGSFDLQTNNSSRGYSIYMDEEENWYMFEPIHKLLPTSQNELEVINDSIFRSEIRNLYNSFSEYMDFSFLEGWSASRVVGIYLYAGEVKDYEAQYALIYKREHIDTLSKDDFLKQAEKTPSYKLEDLYTSFSFNVNEPDENEDWIGIATLDGVSQEESSQQMQLIWEEGIWRIMFD
ncbi:hypothetical protein ACXYMX_15390 [Sporosarcina sp. CAU 1771]